MSTLPVELIDEIIDIVAECSPQALGSCALVSRQWIARSTRHLYRIFRTPTITTFGALHAFLDIVKKHPRLAALATSLEVSPDLELNSTYASYVPFHHLSSSVLPKVRRLVLRQTLRWDDYPLLYRNGTFGFSFRLVTTLDLSCHFTSISDLSRAIRSFKNVEDLRVIHPRIVSPSWIVDQTRIPLRYGALPLNTFKPQHLEISLEILKSVLDVCGDSVVDLSVLCPQMSTVSMDAVEGGGRLAFACSLTSLRAVKITVPVETDDPANHAGLGKLSHLLLAPVTQPGVRYSLFLLRCREHNAVGYSKESTSVSILHQLILSLRTRNPHLKECQECLKKRNIAGYQNLASSFAELRSELSDSESEWSSLDDEAMDVSDDDGGARRRVLQLRDGGGARGSGLDDSGGGTGRWWDNEGSGLDNSGGGTGRWWDNEGSGSDNEDGSGLDDVGENNQWLADRDRQGWSAEDIALFLKLLTWHGDKFERIAAWMENKKTRQVARFYRSHSVEMNLPKIVAEALNRSPTPPAKWDRIGLGSPKDGNPGRLSVTLPSTTAALSKNVS